MGSLNLCLMMPGSLQTDLAHSDHGGLRNHPKCVVWAIVLNLLVTLHTLGLFSALCVWNKLIPFAMPSILWHKFRLPKFCAAGVDVRLGWVGVYIYFYFLRGGGQVTLNFFFFIFYLVRLWLGCIPKFSILACLEVPKKCVWVFRNFIYDFGEVGGDV